MLGGRKMKTFGRVLTAMITPFTEDGRVDFDGAVKLAHYLLDNGSDGLVVVGTTGESPSISKEDKIELFSRITEACGHRGTIIANVGGNTTKQSVELLKAVNDIGVDGVMAVVPYYNKPNQKGLYEHYKTLAEATTLPIMVYNVPGRTGGSITPHTVAQLRKDFSNIVAIKEASGNIMIASEIRYLTDEEFMIYSGDDGLTLPMLSVGGVGVVSVAAHLVGKEMNEMIQLFEAGKVAEAEALNKKLFPIVKAMFVTVNPIPVKYAVRQLGLPAGSLQLPLCEPTEEEAEVIHGALELVKSL